jgi:hypothetical protein
MAEERKGMGADFIPHAIIQAFVSPEDGNLADAIFDLADAVRESGDKIAKAINSQSRAMRSTRSTNGATEEVAVFNKPGD